MTMYKLMGSVILAKLALKDTCIGFLCICIFKIDHSLKTMELDMSYVNLNAATQKIRDILLLVLLLLLQNYHRNYCCSAMRHSLLKSFKLPQKYSSNDCCYRFILLLFTSIIALMIVVCNIWLCVRVCPVCRKQEKK